MVLRQTNTVIVGAGISGLACAASLQRRNIEYFILEKQNQIATPWRNHYDRLHLHTNRRVSHLPYKKFGREIPRYPSRQQVVDYLETYQNEFNIHPVFNTAVISVKKAGNFWITETSNGAFKSEYLIMATGPYGKPRPVRFQGMESFPGKIIHSYEYKTGKDYKGQNVLVVGFVNSACEIAIDLYEQGSVPSMSVRSPVNVIPRDVLGVPVLELSLLLSRLPPWVADILIAPFMNWLIGDLAKLGLKKMSYGPLEEIRRDGNVPVLDIGTIGHIREGHLKIYGDIDFIEGKTVHFKEGGKKDFDAIVAGIGYYRDYAEIVDVDRCRFDDLRVSAGKQKYFGRDGLYFCGYWISPTGQIREISSDAQKIARDIAKADRLSKKDV
jgi:indole-3-pyruvate monooxygenase